MPERRTRVCTSVRITRHSPETEGRPLSLSKGQGQGNRTRAGAAVVVGVLLAAAGVGGPSGKCPECKVAL